MVLRIPVACCLVLLLAACGADPSGAGSAPAPFTPLPETVQPASSPAAWATVPVPATNSPAFGPLDLPETIPSGGKKVKGAWTVLQRDLAQDLPLRSYEFTADIERYAEVAKQSQATRVTDAAQHGTLEPGWDDKLVADPSQAAVIILLDDSWIDVSYQYNQPTMSLYNCRRTIIAINAKTGKSFASKVSEAGLPRMVEGNVSHISCDDVETAAHIVTIVKSIS